MAITRKVVRVRNPRRFRRANGRFIKKSRAGRRRNSTRKKSTTPHIRRVSVKSLKKELKRRGAGVNPRATRRKRTTTARRKRHLKRRRTVKQNPVLIELGAVNPRRRTHVAKTRRRRRKSNPHHRRHAKAVVRVHRRKRRSNPVVHRRRRRRANPIMRIRRRHHRRRNVRRYSRRRNPAIFGSSGGKDLLMMVGGGLVGVAATKYLPTLLPGQITAGLGGGPIMSILIMGAGAFAAGWLARRFVGGKFGDAVLFGGLMQTGSAVLSAFAPGPLRGFALSGMGDIMPGYFPVPQNPITGRPPMAIMPAANGGGMGAFRRAFGGQR